MRKYLLNLGMLCMMMGLATTAYAQDVTATWDFQHMAAGTFSFQKNTGTIASDVEGVDLRVDATNGKFAARGTDAQFNANTILKVPVTSTRDYISVVAYPGGKYHNYTIGGTAADADSVAHKATTAEAAQGYVEVAGTGSSYLYRIHTTAVSAIQEKSLFDTDFTSGWTAVDRKENNETPTSQNFKTKYSHEKLTFTLCGVGVYPDGTNTKFPDILGFMESAKYTNEVKTAEPYVTTSTLASVTKIVFHQAATGGNRGWAVAARSAGNDTWTDIYSQSINTANGEDVEIVLPDTLQKNVELKFFNFNLAQNSYMSELHIYGLVDMSKTPSLATFTANGTTYQAADIFDEDAEGNNVTTIEVTKSAEMPATIEAVAANGEVGKFTYEDVASTANGTKPAEKVTIPVILAATATTEADTASYIINFVWKPDYTVNYYDTDNKTVIATQSVEKDAAIATLNDGGKVTVASGNKFRGWLLNPYKDQKATATTVITENPTNLYALSTGIEGDEDNERYVYNFKNQYFYPEDHEALDLANTQYGYNGNQHGYDLKAGSFSVKTTGNATVIFEGCRYSKGQVKITDAAGNSVTTIAVDAANDGTKSIFKYTGDATTLTFTFDDEIYLHELTVINTGTGDIAKNGEGYYVATPGDGNSLLSILDVIEANEDGSQRIKIFLPNGTYDLGHTVELNLPYDNISIVGQDEDSTIILTTPDISIEGLGSADMFYLNKQNIYFQDVTLKNALDYYGSGAAGRAAVVQDRGNRTIYKNVKMLSYQDTYYSQNSAMQSYFEDCDIHGTVDFICGGGDVRFVNTTISLESRNADGTGGRTITAPTTSTPFGYVFDNCKIIDLAKGNGNWNFGRTWQDSPITVFLNTTLDDNAANTLVSSRWTEKGMNNRDPKQFGEYGTKNEAGQDITPASNIITSYGGQFETILKEDQVAAWNYDVMFKDWDPKALAAQNAVTEAQQTNGTITWTGNAPAYAVFKDNKFQTIVTGNTYDISNDTDAKVWSVRAANEMGGFGPAAEVTYDATGINGVSASTAQTVMTEYYTAGGAKVAAPANGVNIIVKTLADGSKVTSKIVK